MDLQTLVSDYKTNSSSKLKNQIVNEAIPLIRSIIKKIKVPSSILSDHADLFEHWLNRSLQALEKYSPNKDVQFNTFAYYRIRGSIVDHLRSEDELSRGNRAKYGATQKAISELQQLLGRTPTNKEVANEVGLSLVDFENLLSNAQKRVALSLDDSPSKENGFNLYSQIHDSETMLPDHEILEEEKREQLKHAIRSLKEREQLILSLYYFEDYNLREIANELDLSEARISQILGKVLLTLKSELKEAVLV